MPSRDLHITHGSKPSAHHQKEQQSCDMAHLRLMPVFSPSSQLNIGRHADVEKVGTAAMDSWIAPNKCDGNMHIQRRKDLAYARDVAGRHHVCQADHAALIRSPYASLQPRT